MFINIIIINFHSLIELVLASLDCLGCNCNQMLKYRWQAFYIIIISCALTDKDIRFNNMIKNSYLCGSFCVWLFYNVGPNYIMQLVFLITIKINPSACIQTNKNRHTITIKYKYIIFQKIKLARGQAFDPSIRILKWNNNINYNICGLSN